MAETIIALSEFFESGEASAWGEEAVVGEAIYLRGEKPRQEGSRIVERLYLYMEGDGVWVR